MLTAREQELLFLLSNTTPGPETSALASSPSVVSAASSSSGLLSPLPLSPALAASSTSSTGLLPKRPPATGNLLSSSAGKIKRGSPLTKKKSGKDLKIATPLAETPPQPRLGRRPSAGEALASIANKIGLLSSKPAPSSPGGAALAHSSGVDDRFEFSKDFVCIAQDLNNWYNCLCFDDKYLATGCMNSRDIRVFNFQTGQTSLLRGHDQNVYALQFIGSKLVSGSGDGVFKVWNIETGECLNTVCGHSPNGCLCLQFDGEILVTGSAATEVAIWDANTYEQRQMLKGHDDAVWCLYFDSTRIASGSEDASIIVWDRASGEQIISLGGHKTPVRCLHFAGDTLVSGGDDGTVKIWSMASGTCIHTLTAHDGSVICLQIIGNKFITGSFDGTIKVWSIETGKVLQTLTGHSLGVYCLQYRNGILISASEDGSILKRTLLS